ncbi:MAG: hypothetical protein ACI93N_001285, partial [Flavobacteriaceae bacterium]
MLGVWCVNKKTVMYRLTKVIQVSEYREWESNPHIHKDTWPSTMPVYQ